jgi:hypothetical protein
MAKIKFGSKLFEILNVFNYVKSMRHLVIFFFCEEKYYFIVKHIHLFGVMNMIIKKIYQIVITLHV